MLNSWVRIVIGAFLLCCALAGCADLGRNDFANANKIGIQANLFYREVSATPFVLATWQTAHATSSEASQDLNSVLTVYIEGDGAAWINRGQVSPDPTPSNPMALKLAAIDAQLNPGKQLLYLARPCQFVNFSKNPICKSLYWSKKRYSEEVVISMNAVLDKVAKERRTSRIKLVGYSGGAAVALLIAARRKDVESIMTVAGNVDPEGLNQMFGLTPLEGSLNPRKFFNQIKGIPQIYWVGQDDGLITEKFTEEWAARLDSGCVEIILVPGVSHTMGWETVWPTFLRRKTLKGMGCSRPLD